LNIIKDPESLT